MSQAAIGAHLGMNQSEVSRLERRRDVRLSTLRSYVEAAGGRLGLVVTLSDGSRQVELIVAATEPRSDPDGTDPDD